MNLLTNVSPLLPPLTGIGHYTRQLTLHLLASGSIDDLKGVSALRWHDYQAIERMLVDVTAAAELPSEKGTASSVVSKDFLLNLARRVPFARRLKRALAQRTAQQMSNQCRDYVYWEPNYTLLPLDNPSAVTVHDLSHLHFPEYHPSERVDILERTLSESLQKASRVIAVSEYTRQDIAKHFALSADKIDVVSPAVCNSFRTTFSAQALALVRKKHSLPEQYILSVATLEPRKNILGLVRAFGLLSQATRRQFPLVLVGTRGWLTDELDQALAPLMKKGEAMRLGYVDQADLPKVYAAATCMAYVSFFEGYGMPVAEAMTAGVPVVTSTSSSMPEVAAGAAALVDPYDVESISAVLGRMVEDEPYRQAMSLKGKKASAGYTWHNSSERLLSVLRRVESGL